MFIPQTNDELIDRGCLGRRVDQFRRRLMRCQPEGAFNGRQFFSCMSPVIVLLGGVLIARDSFHQADELLKDGYIYPAGD